MIKIKLGELKKSEQTLSKLFNAELPVAISYKLTKLSKLVMQELDILEQKRIELVKKYGKEDEQNQFKVIPEKMNDFFKEMNELLGIEVELNINPISFENVDLKLSTIEIQQLERFIEFKFKE